MSVYWASPLIPLPPHSPAPSLHQHTPATDLEVERESEIAVAPVSIAGISSAGDKIR